MTPEEFKSARRAMGLSLCELADLLQLGSDSKRGGSYVDKMERGIRPITGPVTAHMEALASGWRPENWKDA